MACMRTTIATDIASIPTPAFAAFCPANLLAAITRENIARIGMIAMSPFVMVFGSISPRVSIAPIVIFKAMTIPISVNAAPALTPLQDLRTSLNAASIPNNSPRAINDFPKFKLPRSSKTPTIIFRASAIATMDAALAIDDFPPNLDRATESVTNPTAIPARTARLVPILSALSDSIFFKLSTKIDKDIAIPSIDKATVFKPFPTLLGSAEPSFPISVIRSVNTARTPIRAANAPTAVHNLS